MSNIDSILYTPLDCPAQPLVNLDAINTWTIANAAELDAQRERLANEGNIAERTEPNYPWDVKVIYRKVNDADIGWVGNFDAEFPELAAYFYGAYGLTLDDLGAVVMLPVKKDNVGIGFWHRDPGPNGLRMYLEFEDQVDNKLLLRKVNTPESTVECKMLSNKQCFYLDNTNAEHTTYTTVPGKIRIAILLECKPGMTDMWKQKITSLVESSAAKYPEYAITL